MSAVFEVDRRAVMIGVSGRRAGNVILGAFFSVFLGGLVAQAEVATIDVLFDIDQDSMTGCTVSTVDGDAVGVDTRIRTQFDVGLAMVLSATTSDCVNPAIDLFGAQAPVATEPQPNWVGILGNGAGGSMLIETHVPLSTIAPHTQSRAYVVVHSIVGEDALLSGAGGAPLLAGISATSVPGIGLWIFPLLLIGLLLVAYRRLPVAVWPVGLCLFMVSSLLLSPVPGRALLGEGLHRDWSPLESVGVDPVFDAPAGIDLVGFYVGYDAPTDELWLRVDVLFGEPVCLDWGTVMPGQGYACGMQPPLDAGPFAGAVAMTFDDGPHLVVTPQVLATLRANHIPATFFLVGNRLMTAAERALAKEIHEDPLFRVASHSVTHRRMATLTAEEVETEVTVNGDLIRDAIEDPCYFPRYFRFPFGSSNCTTMDSARTHGYASAAVHIDTSDWCFAQGGGSCPEASAPYVAEAFRDDLPGWAVNRFQASGGGILVMHDIHNNTAAELPAVIAGLQAAGATFVDLADPVLFPAMNATIITPEAPACCEGVSN